MAAHESVRDPQPQRPLAVAVMLETDGPGGAELLLHQLCLELRARGHRVVPVGPERGEGWLSARLQASGFERRTFSLRRALDPGALRAMARMLRAEAVDAVHSHEFTMAVYGCAAARWLGIPHVVTIHGDQGVTAAWRRRAALRWAFRGSHAAVAVSEHTRRTLGARLALRPGRLGVVHNGIPTPAGRRDRLRRELGLGDDELLVLAVGSLRPNKGHRILLDALAGLRGGDGPARWRLAIAGQGDEREALASRAQALGLAGRVHLLGQRDDVEDVHAAADVFAMPSFSEGLPLALLEAMFAGAAIVASGVGGIPEAVTDGEHALLVPPGDPEPVRRALARLLGDPPLRWRLGEAARRRAHAEFRIERMADRYETLYRGGSLADA
jgi:glycosyltransferase involved in cell wall biosynthesis